MREAVLCPASFGAIRALANPFLSTAPIRHAQLQHLDDFSTPAQLRQFQGGQSNPTYLIETPGKKFVLRKKPPGKLTLTFTWSMSAFLVRM